MIASSVALQSAIFGLISTNAELSLLLGGPRIYDDTPQAAPFPYVTFGSSIVREASTATEPGDEHFFTIHAWSRAQGRRELQAILDAVRRLLHDQSFTLIDHRLVNLRHQTSDTRRNADGETLHGVCRFRALTEPVT
jgi:hypothetical protein